jgi:hypothetical protein
MIRWPYDLSFRRYEEVCEAGMNGVGDERPPAMMSVV